MMSNSSGHDVNNNSQRFRLSQQNFERYSVNVIVDYAGTTEPQDRANHHRAIPPETDDRRRETRLGSTFPAYVSRNDGGISEGAASRPLAPEDPPSYSEAIGSSRPVSPSRHPSATIPSAQPIGPCTRLARPGSSGFTTVPPVGSSQPVAALHRTIVADDVKFGSKPCTAFCDGCRIIVRTTTINRFSSKTYCCCFLMFFSGVCCPLSFVPFLVLGRRKVVHTCPQCQQVLGHGINRNCN